MTMTGRELRGAPVVPAALTGLIALAVALAGGAGFLLMGVSSSADRLLDQARSPDLVQMHTGAVDPAPIRDWAAGRPEIREAGVAELLTLRGQDLVIDGHDRASSTQQSSLTVPGQRRDMLIDLEGEPLGVPERGTVSLPVHHRISGAAQLGDEVRVIDGTGWELALTVTGFHRDAAMSTPISSSERLAVHPEDLAEAAARTGTVEHLVEMWLHDPADAGAVSAAYLAAGLPQDGPTVDRSTFLLLSMIGEGLPAALVLLAAAVLSGISILCLHLAVLTALRRSLRQVGVLAALGIPRRGIQGIQAAPFAAIGLLGAGLGTAGGWGLGLLLLRPAGAYLGPVSGIAPWLAPPIAAVLALLLVLATVHRALRGIGRTGIAAALRARGIDRGTGRLRRLATGRLSLQHAARGPLSLRLGLLSAVQRGGTLLLLSMIFAGAMLVMVTPMRAASTLGSPEVIGSLGITPADLLADAVAADDAEPAAAALRQDPAVAEAVAHTVQRATLPDADGLPVPVVVLAGDHTRLPITVAQGRAPDAPGEVALSLLLLADSGLSVGDRVTLSGSGGDGAGAPLRIVGAYQDITQGGRTARTAEPVPGAPTVDHVLSVAMAPGADPATAARRIAGEVPGARVLAVDEYREQLLGPIAARMRAAALLAGAAALALSALVTVLCLRLERAVAARESAIHRAVGVPAVVLRRAGAVPVALALAAALPLGAAAAQAIGQPLLDLVLEGMYGGFEALGQGASALPLHGAPVLTAVLAPAALALVVGAATWAGTRDPHPDELREALA
ncbi:hypothetical protein GCM10009793_06650 [Brachybacterium phenoliresistens]|uniref:ABC3 transporter permease C-terminal domain-containing protein n=2 Tax=Brachybacterium phenoliresistens TaxID=396014 RepID=Z9JMV1_9MICO|nr:hypothetical protein BF93_09745 [Brachybacterium phenoliresistens]